MKSLELFSGAGGLAKGLELAGFEHSFFVEFNKDACKTLSTNFEPEKVFDGDVRDFDLKQLSNVDIVAGGPPCQPFSLGGKHRANNDDRDMFPHAIEAITQLEPKAFVFENVKGLMRASFTDYFDYILLRLTFPNFCAKTRSSWEDHLKALRELNVDTYQGISYTVKVSLLNAADYGVPQTRERVVIVGVRNDLNRDWKFPVRTHSQEGLMWDKHVTGEYWERHSIPKAKRPVPTRSEARKLKTIDTNYSLFEPQEQPWQTIRDVVSGLPDPQEDCEFVDHVFKDGARTYPGHTGSDYDWPSKTIKAGGHGVPGGENMIRFDDGTVRYLTVLEAKRVQTFPDEFLIHGAWGEAMRQIGNAVPVQLAQILGRELMNVLDSSETLQVRASSIPPVSG